MEDNTQTNEEVENTENQENEEQNNATFSQSEVDSHISKAVDKALKNQAKKLEDEKQQAIKDAKKDAENYAKLSKQQQADKEYKDRLDALEKRERELNIRQLTSQVESDLKENDLPQDFAQSLVALDDNEKIKESITNIKKTFDDAVNAKVKETLRQDTPKQGGEPQDKDPIQAKIDKYK